MFAVLAFGMFAAFWLLLGIEIGRHQRDKAYHHRFDLMYRRSEERERELKRLKTDYAALESAYMRSVESD